MIFQFGSPRLTQRRVSRRRCASVGSSEPSRRLTTAPSTIACEWRSITSSTRQSKAATASARTGRAGRERDPLGFVKATRPVGAAVAAEPMGERLVACGEQADRERARLAQSGEGRGRARETDEQRRRRQRKRRERGYRAADPRFAFAASDDCDPGSERPHRMSKGGAVGVAQASVAHARASISRSRALWAPPMSQIAAAAIRQAKPAT